MKIEVNISGKPRWLTRKLAIAVLLIFAAGAGCYLWGSWNVDVDAAIDSYLLSEPQVMIKGRQAGYAVNLVGNETISNNWIAFCNAVIKDCADIIGEKEQ